jgi:hypothetical protein
VSESIFTYGNVLLRMECGGATPDTALIHVWTLPIRNAWPWSVARGANNQEIASGVSPSWQSAYEAARTAADDYFTTPKQAPNDEAGLRTVAAEPQPSAAYAAR